ncbi:hypothetical protein CFIMG_005778RA [Ceratocystis fimbriata CBS 114723]|uniref:Spindle pole body component n=1 Tax=Ceratocystis fimbriata CBS 114723 TaxID=1035309 RepID=A0A2C5WUW9_9PEZI|nr:hypothetical protein CFIMG_005778RA [Ceratocystis fimbriata CBS 114723]
MLHEILLSLAGNPSPLLTPSSSDPGSASSTTNENATERIANAAAISAPERQLIANCAELSELNTKLQSYSGQVRSTHPSMICRAAATAIETEHLREFQQCILKVEQSILSGDSSLVGAYRAVPLTAIIGEFSAWTRRLQWLWEIVQFILRVDEGKPCAGARLVDWLRKEMQTGYEDIETAAIGLVKAAEMAWLKQAAAWILYGRLPGSGVTDFFIQRTPAEEFALAPDLLPRFVTPSAASSMLFVGRALNHPKVRTTIESGPAGRQLLSIQLTELSKLSHPINKEHFSRTINCVRLALSKGVLQKLLPLEQVCSTVMLFREFFLLGRGEFPMILTHEADEKNRSRWRRADNLAYEKRDALGNVIVKQGEVTRVLGRVWATLGSMQGLHADEDEELELARELIRLELTKSKPQTPLKLAARASSKSTSTTIADTPFRNLLFAVPTMLTIPEIPSPLDMFLAPSDVQIYSAINSYLLSIKRAHLRLTDLWKATALRRHHPAPPGPPGGSSGFGSVQVKLLRQRQQTRSLAMRSAWVTCSAAVFFLSETEAYLQSEIVAGLWENFHSWLVSSSSNHPSGLSNNNPQKTRNPRHSGAASDSDGAGLDEEQEDAHDGVGGDGDIWLHEKPSIPESSRNDMDSRHSGSRPASRRGGHRYATSTLDPQSISVAHRVYLRALAKSLFLTQSSFTDSLYNLLVNVDQLVALIHSLQEIWASIDLEEDAGVVDAFVDLGKEEKDTRHNLRVVEEVVKRSTQDVVAALRALEADSSFMADIEDDTAAATTMDGEGDVVEETEYVPLRVGGISHLLMKLDFGTWFGGGSNDDGLQEQAMMY